MERTAILARLLLQCNWRPESYTVDKTAPTLLRCRTTTKHCIGSPHSMHHELGSTTGLPDLSSLLHQRTPAMCKFHPAV